MFSDGSLYPRSVPHVHKHPRAGYQNDKLCRFWVLAGCTPEGRRKPAGQRCAYARRCPEASRPRWAACYGKLRKQTDCTGQTGYTMHILDEIIDKMVRQIFSRLRGIPKEQLITSRYAKETAERKNHLQALQAERDKAEKDLLALKTEILAVIKGESAFPKDTLAEMIAAQEKKHTELETLCEEASAELERNAELMANVSQLYEELISYADLYDSASFEAKKMIVSQLIRRVEVYRGYQIHVDFNFDLAQYLENSDELAC